MKNQIILLFSIILVGCNSQQYNDLESMNIFSKVKSINSSTYNAEEKFGQPTKTTFYKGLSFDFNDQGNIIQSIWKNTYGNKSTILYKYNSEGNKIEKLSNSDEEIEKSTYKYNLKKKVEENVFYSNGKLKSKDKYNYNENNYIKEIYNYNSQGKLTYKIVNLFNDKNQIYEEKWYDSKGKLYNNTKYIYDDNGNETSMDSDLKGFTPTKFTYIYTYDKFNNWTSRIVYLDDSLRYIEDRKIVYY